MPRRDHIRLPGGRLGGGAGPDHNLIQGQVLRPDGSPLAGIEVRAFDAGFRRERLLGSDVADADGRYGIVYLKEVLGRRRERARLVVKAFAAGGREPLAASPVLFDAPAEVVVDLVPASEDRGPSEYGRHLEALHAATGGAAPAELTPEEVELLSATERVPARRLALLAAAHRQAGQAGVEPEVLYGLFRQGLPTDLSSLLLQPSRRWRRALESSAAAGLIAADTAQRVPALVKALAAARARALPAGEEDEASVADLLEASGVGEAARRDFLSRYVEHEGPLDDFWSRLRGDGGLPAPQVEALETTFHLAHLTRNNLPLMRAVRERAGTGAELTAVGREEWEELVAVHPRAGERPGADEVRREVDRITERLEETFPLDYLRRGAAREPGLGEELRRDLGRFFESAPDYDFETAVDAYVVENPAALRAVENPGELTRELKRLQRVYQVAPHYRHLRALVDRGYHSAYAIADTSLDSFLEEMSGSLGGEERAAEYHAEARSKASLTAHLFTAVYQLLNEPAIAAAMRGHIARLLEQVPGWESLFGSVDFCQCRHCRSIHGPAAYLVELLEMLRRGGPPFTALALRRPDLQYLKLSCENTNTPLPYLDLAIEVMEFRVAHGPFETMTRPEREQKGRAMAKDTGRATAEELAINPQHTEEAAYDALAQAAFGFHLPFDRPLATVRAYLEHLGTTRWEVMATFRGPAGPTDGALARESLAISPAELEILTGASAEPARAFYGYPSEQVRHTAAGGPPVTEDWRVNLARAPEFLRRTGLEYGELTELLKTRFVNPVQDEPLPPDTVVLWAPGSACELDKTRIRRLGPGGGGQGNVGLTETDWTRLHRFLRLWKKLGWTLSELDGAMAALGLSEVTADALATLARVERLRRELSRPVERLLGFWAPLDTFGDGSPYERLFLNRAVLNPPDPAFALAADRSELADVTAPISDHGEALQAGLRVNAADLALLRAAAGVADETAKLDLASLSALYRRAVLARSLRLKVRDYVALEALAGEDPFASPAATEAFVERARNLRESGFTAAEADYLFRHHAAVGGPAPALDRAAIFLGTLKADLEKVIAETRPVPDPTGTELAERLATLLDAPRVDEALAIVERRSDLSAAEQEQFIDGHFAAFMDPAAAKTALLAPLGADLAAERQERRALVLSALLPHLRELTSRGLAKQSLATALALDGDTARLLLEETLAARTVPGAPALADFLSLPEVAPEDRLPDYLRLHKIALIVNRLDASPEEAAHLAAQGPAFGGFDPNGLPLERPDDQAAAIDAAAPALFAAWEEVAGFFRLRDGLSSGDLTLLDVASAPTAGEARARLARLAGCDRTLLDLLAGPSGLGIPDDAFRTAAGPARLARALDLARRTGVAAERLLAWSRREPDVAQAQEVVQAVKAKYDQEVWPEAARPLADALRAARRDALVSYLLAEPSIVARGIEDENGLFEFFLIDPAMDPCMATSRVKQAISSVQLFVNRCLLNLESGVAPSAIDAGRWEWMRSYRVWEANRKVFLWPENWILPELRDDKSPFFKEMETRLLQGEVTEENAEQALLEYLEKLDEVSRLKVVGLERQREGSGSRAVDLLHVVARTHHEPASHFYRRFDARRNRWTPWERVPLDIPGGHLVPVVWNRRLYLFWPEFTETADPLMSQDLPDGVDPLTQSEIRFAWSEHKEDHWTPRQVTKSGLFSRAVHDGEIVNPDGVGLGGDESEAAEKGYSVYRDWYYLPRPEEHYFRAALDGDELVIEAFRRFQSEADFAVSATLLEATVVRPTVERVESHDRLGAFRFTGCRGRVELDDAGQSLPFDAIGGPEAVTNEFMGFAARTSAGELQLRDAGQTRVLGKLETGFDFLPPAQEEDAPGEKLYPFIFEDERRAYCVMPVADPPRRHARLPGFSRTRLLPWDDALVARFPATGDPGLTFRKGAVRAGALAYAQAKPPAATAQVVRFPTTRHVSAPAGGAAARRWIPPFGGETVRMRYRAGGRAGGAGVGVARVVRAAARAAALDVRAQRRHLEFHALFHPHTCAFIKALNRGGVPELLSLGTQSLTNDPAGDTLFDDVYSPAPIVHPDHPRENVDFRPEGAYALYNWELFFHAPVLLADRLAKSRRFPEALRWLHAVFDPTSDSREAPPARYWKFLPFRSNTESGRLVEMLRSLANGRAAAKNKLVQQVEEWRDNPFNPHLVARLRMMAYQKFTVMRYVDALLAWGDELFARDSLESLNEATQLYVLAHNLLGRRPAAMPSRVEPEERSYAEIRGTLDGFSNALVQMENAFPFASGSSRPARRHLLTRRRRPTASLGTALTFYFCVPPNEKLLEYWDRVEDRLFKIRHCMNIEGVERQLPLFEPPIDPALLVKAQAAGLDLGSVLNDLAAPLPPYRFPVLVRKAREICEEAKGLGQALLSTLEKKDAEALASLRATQEAHFLAVARETKRLALKEAAAQLEALRRARKVTEERHRFYSEFPFMIDAESTQVDLMLATSFIRAASQMLEMAAASAQPAPDVSVGGAGSMGSPLNFNTVAGGAKAGAALQAAARGTSILAGLMDTGAALAGIFGTNRRRADDAKLQAELAKRELRQVDKQILAAEIRLDLAEKELESHDVGIQNARAVEEFFRRQYTNEELYGWMLTQISAAYFQTYKLAYDTAKRAEAAYRYERGLTDSAFIQFGYWDGLRKGLLAGEKLSLDLHRLETAYLEQNRREHELSKTVSLALLDPMALVTLRETGACEVDLEEALFDLDHPGHYLRRLKSVSLTLPCVAGPYANVNCRLTLLKSTVRIDPTAQGDYLEDAESDDPRFTSRFGALQSIATSSGRDDSGLFQLDFRDDRYLPFEGAGAISRWRLELPRETNAFDLDTLSDVLLHLRYTARDGGSLLRKKAREAVVDALPQEGLPRLFSARHEFPDAWHRFLHPADAETAHRLELELSQSRFPFPFRGKTIELDSTWAFLKLKEGASYQGGSDLACDLSGEEGASFPGKLLVLHPQLALPHALLFEDGQEAVGRWLLSISESGLQAAHPDLRTAVVIDGQERWRLDPAAIDDLWLLCRYTVSAADG